VDGAFAHYTEIINLRARGKRSKEEKEREKRGKRVPVQQYTCLEKNPHIKSEQK
jgi:hypothetical protein